VPLLDQSKVKRIEAEAASRRQLAWPVDDNYLGRLDLHRDGPEAGVTVNS
jgi:hypothetical protein